MLALVGEDHGPSVALACAKALVVVAQRQGGQSQFSPLLVPISAVATPLGKVQTYIMDHVREAFPVERLAEIAAALKAIAFDCGFAGPDQSRSAFQRRLNVSPVQYRGSFKRV